MCGWAERKRGDVKKPLESLLWKPKLGSQGVKAIYRFEK
jgi:hypothetical protein